MKKSPTTPLLTRLTDLFRKSDSDEPQSAQPSQAQLAQSDSIRLQLKRKRRDDAIRGYEFNQLRGVIRNGRGFKISDVSMVPTATRSSGLSALERDSILDKIDGAQAHLEQWWGSESSHTPLSAEAQAPGAPQPAQNPENEDLDLDFTCMPDLASDQTPTEPTAEPELTLLESGIRDAALLFAEAEYAAAQTVLTTLLRAPALDSDSTELLTFALFDVYRCAGQHDLFDALALDYANRFGRSPAEWFSLSDLAPHGNAAGASSDVETPQQAAWECPAILTPQALAYCITLQPATNPISAINWTPLQHIDAATATHFGAHITALCENPVGLHWVGMDSLMAAVQMCRLSADAATSQQWWLIQLDMLRIHQQAEAFEELALEYCVVFEVSPPSWISAACKLVSEDSAQQDLESLTTGPSHGLDVEPDCPPAYVLFDLNGNITGDTPRALRELRKASHGAAQITVSCARLGRIDFRAAAELMHWANECRSRGSEVQFILLPRLVLVYFHMLGMETTANLSAGSY